MQKRIDNVRKILKEKQLDAILIKSKSNKRYIGALVGSGVKVLVRTAGLWIVPWRPETP